MTTPSPLGSEAKPAPPRAGGDESGLAWVQLLPSHVQVSPNGTPGMAKPPNSTMVCVAAFRAIEAENLAVGLLAGVSSFQVVPSHAQVAALATPPEVSPPKSKIW
jgi:hypothetical protein